MSESYLPSIERKNLARTVRLLADFYNTIGTDQLWRHVLKHFHCERLTGRVEAGADPSQSDPNPTSGAMTVRGCD